MSEPPPLETRGSVQHTASHPWPPSVMSQRRSGHGVFVGEILTTVMNFVAENRLTEAPVSRRGPGRSKAADASGPPHPCLVV